jgi:hypothetical protein
MPNLHSLADFFMMYFLLAIPALIYAVIKMVEVRRSEGKYLRCAHCGHSGKMTSVLVNKDIGYAVFFLLLLGVLPGVAFISWGSRRYPCKRCGTVSSHLSSSESLANSRSKNRSR